MFRYPTLMTMLGMLLAAGLGTPPIVAAASTTSGTPTQTVQWTSSPLVATTSLPPADPTSTVPQVVIAVSPADAIVPPPLPNGTPGSPLTVPANITGFDPKQLVVALLNTKDASGNPVQELGLNFFGTGVKAGTSIPLTLSINSAMAGTPPTLKALTPGFAFQPNPPSTSSSTTSASSNNSSNTGSGSNGNGNAPASSGNAHTDAVAIPEPLPLVLWSAIVVGLAARKRFSPHVLPA